MPLFTANAWGASLKKVLFTGAVGRHKSAMMLENSQHWFEFGLGTPFAHCKRVLEIVLSFESCMDMMGNCDVGIALPNELAFIWIMSMDHLKQTVLNHEGIGLALSHLDSWHTIAPSESFYGLSATKEYAKPWLGSSNVLLVLLIMSAGGSWKLELEKT
eukprot:Gb_34611 [translate_table: standard]